MAKSKQQIANEIYTGYWYLSRKEVIAKLTSEGGTISVSKAHASTLYQNAKKKFQAENEMKMRIANQPMRMEMFSNDGMYLHYHFQKHAEYNYFVDRGEFIARFKYGPKPFKAWSKFMVKNFSSLYEYIRASYETSPLDAMQSKGYLHSHIKKQLKKEGYSVSLAGFNQMIADQVATINGPTHA